MFSLCIGRVMGVSVRARQGKARQGKAGLPTNLLPSEFGVLIKYSKEIRSGFDLVT